MTRLKKEIVFFWQLKPPPATSGPLLLLRQKLLSFLKKWLLSLFFVKLLAWAQRVLSLGCEFHLLPRRCLNYPKCLWMLASVLFLALRGDLEIALVSKLFFVCFTIRSFLLFIILTNFPPSVCSRHLTFPKVERRTYVWKGISTRAETRVCESFPQGRCLGGMYYILCLLLLCRLNPLCRFMTPQATTK